MEVLQQEITHPASNPMDTSMDIDMDVDLGPLPEPELEPIDVVSEYYNYPLLRNSI